MSMSTRYRRRSPAPDAQAVPAGAGTDRARSLRHAAREPRRPRVDDRVGLSTADTVDGRPDAA